MKPVYVNGVIPDPQNNSLSSCIRDTLLKTTNGLSWLSPGDVILLKPALNSGDPYPATTHPLAIDIISKILAEYGAKVVIGDQSGIEHVVHHQAGVFRGNSRENYIRSGMGAPQDTRFISFEQEGWDEGFFHYTSKNTSSWKNGFFITRCIRDADHIINLPRLSTHSIAGVTLGLKNMVGLLRDDSRMEFHANGPFNNFIKKSAEGSMLRSVDDRSGTFFEKIVEISDAVKDKLRLTLFVATQAQATFGPDSVSKHIWKKGIGRAYVTDMKPGLVFGSPDPVAADAFAIALLKDIRRYLPFLKRCSQRIILFQNPYAWAFDNVPVLDNSYIRHGIKIGLGDMPGKICYENVPDTVQERLKEYLK